jgi:O-antigen/teichoic acid export membrane protein
MAPLQSETSIDAVYRGPVNLAMSAARGAVTTLGGQAIRLFIQLASLSVLARVLSPSDSGSFAMVLSIVGVASVLGDFGLSLSAIQSQTITHQQRSNLFWTNILLGAVLSLTIFLCSPLVAAFFGKPELGDVMRVMSISFLINALAPQFRAEMTSRLRFRALASTDLVVQTVGLAVAVICAIAGAGYWALVAQQMAVAVVSVLILAILARWLPALPKRVREMRPLYTFGLHTLITQVVNYITSNVDNILVGKFFGSEALGIYSRAYQIFNLPLAQFAAPMTRVALPVLSRLNSSPRYSLYIERAQLLLSYCFCGFFFVLAVLASPIVNIVLGPRWSGAVPVVTILAIGGVFQSLGYVYYWIFLSRARTGLQLKYGLIGRGAMIALMCAGVVWGPIGVAIGSSLGQAALWIVITIFAIPKTGVDTKRLVRIAIRPVAIYAVLLAIALPASLIVTINWNPWLQLCLLCAAIVVYFGCVWLVFASVRSDVSLIWDTIRRASGRGR